MYAPDAAGPVAVTDGLRLPQAPPGSAGLLIPRGGPQAPGEVPGL